MIGHTFDIAHNLIPLCVGVTDMGLKIKGWLGIASTKKISICQQGPNSEPHIGTQVPGIPGSLCSLKKPQTHAGIMFPCKGAAGPIGLTTQEFHVIASRQSEHTLCPTGHNDFSLVPGLGDAFINAGP